MLIANAARQPTPGERIFDADVDVDLEPLEAEHSPWATHVRYRVRR